MNYGVLAVSSPSLINIGDYIQAVAARQFLPKLDVFIDREQLREYNGEPVKIIMNGYYMHDGTQWPPSPKIIPLFVAVHINTLVKDYLLSDESIAYFKQHEPIGCRDKYTMHLLQNKGVDAYFSGCLTLTLGQNYHSDEKNDDVYIVDPVITFNGRAEGFIYLLKLLMNWSKIKHINDKLNNRVLSFRNLVYASKFFLTYRKMFDEVLLLNAIYINHECREYNELASDKVRFQKAELLVAQYAKAKLVITSRIHCALPCLAVDTPVIYIYNDLQVESSYCRMDGLVQMFNTIHWDGYGLKTDLPYNNHCKISNQNYPQNRRGWEKYANDLLMRCRSFISL